MGEASRATSACFENRLGPMPSTRHVSKSKGRFSRVRIAAILTEHQAGTSVAELCRRYGMSSTAFYRWRSKFRPPGPTGEALPSRNNRLTVLEDENRRLKKLLAETVLEIAALKERLYGGKN